MPDIRHVCPSCAGHGYVIGSEMAGAMDHHRLCSTCRGEGTIAGVMPVTHPRLMLPQARTVPSSLISRRILFLATN